MAKKNNMVPVPTGGGVLPKLIGIAVTLALLVFVVKHPADAASGLKALIDAVGGIVDGIATFFQQAAR
jgi:hypothetical protein